MRVLNHSVLVCLVTGVLTLFMTLQVAQAAVEVKDLPGNIHLGPIRIHPEFSVKEIYTDNYFLEDDNEKDDWITVLIPGITLQLPFGEHMFQFDYYAEIFRHSDFSDYNTENHKASGLLDLKFPWGLALKIADEYTKSRTHPEFDGDTEDDYHYNDAGVEASYQLAGRYKVKVGYRNVIKEFWAERNEVDNFVRHEGYVGLYYRFLPKTNLLVEYTYYHMDNEDNGALSTDNDNHHFWAGLEWEPGAKIKGGIKGGYTMRRYDEVGQDEDTFGMSGDITYYLANFTTLHLEAVREIIQTEVSAEDDPFATHYIRTGALFSVTYKFPFWTGGLHELSATAKGFYYNEDYRERGAFTEEREDDRYGGGVGINYQFWDRVNLKVEYQYTENESNFRTEEYRENQVFIQFSLVL